MDQDITAVTGFGNCTGCAVCLLTCPVWRRTHDVLMTNCGRTRALQAGAAPEDLEASAEACLFCGACAAVCPSGVDTLSLTAALRAALPQKRMTAGRRRSPASFTYAGRTVLLPGPDLRADALLLEKLASLLDAAVPPCDELSDLAADLDAGLRADPERLRAVTAAAGEASGLVAAEGFALRHLRKWFPALPSKGLGEALLGRCRGGLRPGDLYVVDARAFNSDRGRLIRLYDALRQETGCALSTSLQRAAIPAGPARGTPRSADSETQARWVLGRFRPRRVVVESPSELGLYGSVAEVPVLHLGELA